VWGVEKSARLVVREVPGPEEPASAFERLRAADAPAPRHAWLLESALSGSSLGRFSFAGASPYAVLRARDTRLELEVLRAARPGLAPGRMRLRGDPLEAARALLPRLAPAAAPELPFVGGAVGWLGYELAARIEPIALRAGDGRDPPDLALFFVDRVAAFDHATGRLYACGLGFGPDARDGAERAADAVCRALAAAPPGTAAGRGRALPLPDAAEHVKKVDCILEEIRAGNVYQACLTTRFEGELEGDAFAFYRRLRELSPAPFASFLELPGIAVVGSSPERFLRLDRAGRVESRPIKGTRPRGRGPAEDAGLRLALESSAKERAENLMIVDLVRNDLGRVCETGSIAVPELMAIEAYAPLFQMVSSVTGRLRPDRDVFDLVRACFPAGSMTGAPKIAAMRLLARLEPLRRGVYSGALGYLDARGGADLSVVIRTAVVADGRVAIHAGGGIVADSDPAAEWREAVDKAAPLRAALAGGPERRRSR